MRPKIWLRSPSTKVSTWMEWATDDQGTLDISSIANKSKLHPEFLGKAGVTDGITIEMIREANGPTAGESKITAVLVEGSAQPAAHLVGSKKPRIEDPIYRSLQTFTESAAKYYREWEEAQNAGCEGGVGKNFMVVSQDPFANYPDGFVVWIRKCYRDLKEILTKAPASRRFVLLGTAGIGKSVFTLFWICFRATLGEKVVWKTSKDAWYLLDFSKEGPASARRLEESAHELRSVLDDREAWLIIDGGQRGPLTYACHILVACSLENENYKQFSKNLQVSLRYVPAWSEEEMNKFLDDFKALRGSYSHMLVPEKDEAMESFEKLGGVPRYVLHSGKTAEAISLMDMAVNYLDKASCLKYFTGTFKDAKISDSLVHIKCEDESYESWFYDFASPYVKDEFGKRFTRLSKVDVVDFLRFYAYKDAGSVYGYIFELVAHQLMQRGGKFPMKRVGFKGAALSDPEPDTLELSSSMTVVEFAKVQELVNQDTYYRPLNLNFESVDAVVYPRILLQFFRSRRGIHGYKVKGLKVVHEHLKQDGYLLCSCVPKEQYDSTGFQQWLNVDGPSPRQNRTRW